MIKRLTRNYKLILASVKVGQPEILRMIQQEVQNTTHTVLLPKNKNEPDSNQPHPKYKFTGNKRARKKNE